MTQLAPQCSLLLPFNRLYNFHIQNVLLNVFYVFHLVGKTDFHHQFVVDNYIYSKSEFVSLVNCLERKALLMAALISFIGRFALTFSNIMLITDIF